MLSCVEYFVYRELCQYGMATQRYFLVKKKKKNSRCLDETQKSCQKIWRPFSGNKRLKYCSKRVNFDGRYIGLVRRVPTKAAAPLIFLFFTSIYVSRLRKILNIFVRQIKMWRKMRSSFHKCGKATARTQIPAYCEKGLINW